MMLLPTVRQVSKLVLTKLARGSRELSHAGRRTPHYPAMACIAGWHSDTNHEGMQLCRSTWVGCGRHISVLGPFLAPREHGQHALGLSADLQGL